jgi:starvation-inducible DNA-binding protein
METIAVGANYNPLPNPSKRNSGETLIGLVADGSGLYHQVKTAHWNLRDPNFLTIHRLLDEVTATLLKGIDAMAERARQLGMIVDGNMTTVASMSRIGDFPVGIVSASQACTVLCQSISSVVESLRRAIESMDADHPDPITADLLTKISGEIEVQLWFLESHIP